MERNINKDFEQFVKQNADQYRMYPSEKVWKGVYSALHRRTWYGLGLALLLLTAVTVTWVMLSSPAVKQQIVNAAKNQDQSLVTAKKSNNSILISTSQNNNLAAPFISQANHNESSSIFTGTAGNADPGTEHQLTPSVDMSETAISNNNNANSHKEITTTTTPIAVNIKDQATDNEYDISRLNTKQTYSVNTTKTTARNNVYPMSIESVLNSYKAVAKSKKLNWQLYFTPTVSYRRLTENKSFLRNTSTASGTVSYTSLYDINSVVTHKPDMGLELGIAGSYPLTKNLKARAGLQFNINRYGIKAFTYPGEVATIALNSGNDSVARWTNYRNFNGYNSNWLQNFYFSVSAPLGVELNLSGKSKTQFGIAGTIQPTFVIGDRAYLISTDYKNYVQVPWLIRRWNVNTSLETFVSYSTGKINWKVGPQVRYQLLSSFQNKYPVKENLFDFGLKVGIMLNK